MDVVRQVTSLGLSARNSVNIKVRQPLATVLVHVRDGQQTWDENLPPCVTEELNVKALQFVDDEVDVVAF